MKKKNNEGQKQTVTQVPQSLGKSDVFRGCPPELAAQLIPTPLINAFQSLLEALVSVHPQQ